MLVLLPTAALYIAFGLLFGVLLTDKQAAPINSILVNVAALLGGTWFDLTLVGGTFERICTLLPFVHATESARAALAGNYAAILPHLAWVSGWAALLFAAAVLLFKKKMREN